MESPCYELNKIAVVVTNPFQEDGEFRILLVESKGDILGSQESLAAGRRRKPKKVKSRINHGQNKPESPVKEETEQPPILSQPDLAREEGKAAIDMTIIYNNLYYIQ